MSRVSRRPGGSLPSLGLPDQNCWFWCTHMRPLAEVRPRTSGRRSGGSCRKFGVCCSLIPTDPPDRELRLPLFVCPDLPCRRAWPASRVPEFRHGLFPTLCAAILHERLLPVITPLVAAGVDELFELPVGDFVLVEPELLDLHPGKTRDLQALPWDEDHVFRRRVP